MNISDAYFYSLCILSFSLAIKTLEHLFSWSIFSPSGILSWQVSRSSIKVISKSPFAYFFNATLKDNRFKILLWFKFFISIILFTLSCYKINAPLILFLEFILLLMLSFRSFYGIDGAYHMSLVISGSLLLVSIFGFNSNIAQFCMYYITAQLILSYFIAGIQKFLAPVWRDGSAMPLIFRTEAYGNPFIFKLVDRSKFIKLFLSWSVILFETLFPLIIFVDKKFVIYFLIIAFTFHFMIAIFMGLNSFLLVFTSSYPIALCCLSSINLIYIALPLLFYLIIPFLLIAWLWSNSPKTILGWLFRTLVIIIYLVDMHIGGFSQISGLGYITTYFLFVFFFISMIKSMYSLIKTKKEEKKINLSRNYLSIICHAFLLVLTGLTTWEISFVLKGAKSPGNEIELVFPLKSGSYYIAQGGDNSLINHHYNVSGQKYALDIVQINRLGLRFKRIMPSKLIDYNIFETKLYSPAVGTIVKIFNQAEDFIPPKTDPKNPVGNYIVLKVENTNKAILLAHLLKGSIKVNEGDKVQLGQLIGQVGNSGNTSEPHLHMHCVEINDRKDYIYDAKAVPMTFNKTFLVRNSVYSSD